MEFVTCTTLYATLLSITLGLFTGNSRMGGEQLQLLLRPWAGWGGALQHVCLAKANGRRLRALAPAVCLSSSVQWSASAAAAARLFRVMQLHVVPGVNSPLRLRHLQVSSGPRIPACPCSCAPSRQWMLHMGTPFVGQVHAPDQLGVLITAWAVSRFEGSSNKYTYLSSSPLKQALLGFAMYLRHGPLPRRVGCSAIIGMSSI